MKKEEYKERKLLILQKILQSENDLRSLIVECKNDSEMMKDIKSIITFYETCHKELCEEYKHPEDIDVTDYR